MTKSIPDRESLTVEFKSDRDRLPDRDLVAAVICLANSDGGEVFVGVKDDGTVTGLHAAHRNVAGLAAMIANSTVPPLSVRVEALEVEGHSVAKITVRQAGFDPIQQEQMVLQYAQSHGRITRKDAAALCQISEDQASRLLRKLSSDKKLRPEGKGRGTSYALP